MYRRGDLFISYTDIQRLNNINGERHGKPWTAEEMARLVEYFKMGMPLKELVAAVKRSVGGVIPKLMEKRLIFSGATLNYYYNITVYSEKEHQMNKTDFGPISPIEKAAKALVVKTIEDITLIRDFSSIGANLSDDDIFQLIAELERQKTSFEAIQNKPKKLQDKIAGITADIQRLCEFVDGRPAM